MRFIRQMLGGFFLVVLLTACNDSTSGPTGTPRAGALPESISVTATVDTTASTASQAQRTATPTTTRATTAGPRAGKTPQPTHKPTLTPTAGPTIVFTSVQGGRPSDIASAAIKGPPSTQCTIAYYTPARTLSQAPGLAPMMTDRTGLAVWTWTIAQSTRPGMGRIDVACGKLKATARITIAK